MTPQLTVYDIGTKLDKNPSYDFDQESFLGQTVTLKVCENHRKPGEPILVLDCGKVGFPSHESRIISIGQTVEGTIVFEHEKYFLIKITKINS